MLCRSRCFQVQCKTDLISLIDIKIYKTFIKTQAGSTCLNGLFRMVLPLTLNLSLTIRMNNFCSNFTPDTECGKQHCHQMCDNGSLLRICTSIKTGVFFGFSHPVELEILIFFSPNQSKTCP